MVFANYQVKRYDCWMPSHADIDQDRDPWNGNSWFENLGREG